MKAIDRAMAGARRKTKAEVARKLDAGLPIYSLVDGNLVVERVVDKPEAKPKAKRVKSTEIRSRSVKARAVRAREESDALQAG